MTVAVTSRFNEEQFMNWSVYVNEHYLVHGWNEQLQYLIERVKHRLKRVQIQSYFLSVFSYFQSDTDRT